MDQVRRYPHDDSGKLLVFERRQSPRRGGIEMHAIKRMSGQGQQRAQEPVLYPERGDEYQGASIVETTSAKGLDHERPEHQCGNEKTEVFERMNPFAA